MLPATTRIYLTETVVTFSSPVPFFWPHPTPPHSLGSIEGSVVKAKTLHMHIQARGDGK